MKPAILFALIFPSVAFADTAQLVENALAGKPDPADPAIVALRAAGPEAFRELERHLEPRLKEYAVARRFQPSQAPAEDMQRAADLLSAASGQRDSYASRLFWFTDFEAAKAEATRLNRPIISLRMLGKLTDEYSCANSRLFRSLLYTDPKISSLLRDKCVLYWESVRPVPQVTIDYGDGRVLRRTVTGNSIHYILTPDGRIADALPGMYQPKVFAKELAESLDFLAEHENRPSDGDLKARLADKRAKLENAYTSDLEMAGVLKISNQAEPKKAKFPSAGKTMALAASKSGSELSLVKAVTNEDIAPYLKGKDDPAVWEKIAALHKGNTVSTASQDFMKAKMPNAMAAAETTRSKMIVENPLLRMFARLEISLAADTVRNQYDFRPKILRELDRKTVSLTELNDWVYAQLFLTPKEDAWLGLRSDDVFSAIENDGIEISQ